MNEALQHLESSIAKAWDLMEEIGRRTRDEPGITRAAWSAQDELAAELCCEFAQANGLEIQADAFGNFHVLLPGDDPSAPAVTAGSHLDSVSHGGNYDGLAGVAAALAVLAAVRASGTRPRRTLRAIAMRCEESPWFGTAYLGSRLMLGTFTLDQIGDLIRFDSGQTLRAHMAELGYPKPGRMAPLLTKENTAAMFELHIEQGPLLGSAGVPVGIATASRGNIRFPNAICRGAYAHSAALPRRFRQDAVLAVSELALGLDRYWAERTEAGDDNLVVTVGKFFTDPDQHAMTKVAGEVTFSLNIGAAVLASQQEARAEALRLIGRIEQERGVRFELGAEVGTPPTPLSEPLLQRLEAAARNAGIATKRMPTAGHDTAMFVRAGIPGAVILVHNEGGSHNPAEALALTHFAAGTTVLAGAMLEMARS